MSDTNKKKGPITFNMLLPIITKYIGPLLLSFIIPHIFAADKVESISFTFNIFLQMLVLFISNLMNRNNICSNITVNSVGKSLGDTINISCISEITQYGLPLLLNLIPGYLGVVVLVENIPLIGSYAESIIDNFYWTIGFIISYMSINMTNYSNSTDYCAKTFFGTKWNMFFVLVSILILVSIHAYTFIKNNVFDIILGFF